MNIKRLQDKFIPSVHIDHFHHIRPKTLTTSLCGLVQNNSICLKREYNDRQTHKIGHNILSLSFTVFAFHHSLSRSLSLTHTHTCMHARLERLGGRPWPRHSQLVPVPTRKQLIMCERLSECLLSGQQQHSAIYLPSRQDSEPAHHAGMHSLILKHTHTLSQMWKNKNGQTQIHSNVQECAHAKCKYTCTENTLMQAHGRSEQQL